MPDEVDSWYSWVIVGVGFVVTFMNLGILRISGLFYSHIISYYNVDREQASTPFLIGSVARAISGPVSGYLSHRFGFRFAIGLGCLLSTLGIFACSFAQNINAICIFWCVHGFGLGMATSIFPRVINLYNKKHASRANGISTAGTSIAGITLSPLTVTLLNTYGMPGTLLILSAIMLNTIPATMLLRNPNSNRIKVPEQKLPLQSRDDGSSNDEQKCSNVFNVFWDPVFVIFATLRGFCALLFVIIPTIIVDFAIDKETVESQAPYVLVAYSVGDLAGKAGLGWITDGNYISRIRYASLCFGMRAFSCVLMVWANGFLFMMVGVFLVATSNATVSTTLVVLIGEFFKKEKQSMAMASSEILLLPMSFGTAPLIGYFRDNIGSYDGLAYTLGAASLACSGLVLLVPTISNWRTSVK